jgi:hypothetical protein
VRLPAIDDAAFFGDVRFERLNRPLTSELLADALVRQRLLEAVRRVDGGTVTLTPVGVTLEARGWAGNSEEQTEAADRAAVMLAIAIERWVRGTPGAPAEREGCVDRPQPARMDPGVPRDPSLPWCPPESFLREPERPGPPCPACGEPMTDHLTECVCKSCGHEEDRPEVRASLRRSERLKVLVGIGIALGLGLFIALSIALD